MTDDREDAQVPLTQVGSGEEKDAVMKPWMRWMPAWIVAGLALCGTAAAQDASGVFESGGASFEIVDAYAFRGESALDGEPVWVVAVSNETFRDERVARYVDRRYVLDNYFRSDRSAVVFLEIEDDGTFRGLSSSFGPGGGCGFCRDASGAVKVEVDGRRITGTLAWTGDGHALDAEIDVAISSRDHGEPLGAGGGEPGAAYMAFHRAILSRDEVALELAFSRAVNTDWAEAAFAGQEESYLQSWIEDHPKEIDEIRGWARDDRAVLVVAGWRAGRELEAEVLLVREDGNWRVDDEMVRRPAEAGQRP